jgi:hypothetical protein
VFAVLYSPYDYWQLLSVGLQGLSEGNATVFFDIYGNAIGASNATLDHLCDAPQPEFDANTANMQRAVVCGDARLEHHTYDRLSQRLVNASEHSFFGGLVMGFEVACS